MATLVHIADERHARSITRSGLRLARARFPPQGERPWGVFALPVVPNFVVSHQWVREIKKRGFRVAVGVYFSIPDSEPVWAGHFNQAKQLMPVAQAAAVLQSAELGFEVIVPRSVEPGEVRAVRRLPQVLGWRHFPGSHARGIFCGCKFCQRGEMNSRGIQERYGRGEL